jgi:hypothetical protein
VIKQSVPTWYRARLIIILGESAMKFDVNISPQFKGGRFFCTFNANSSSEVLDKMRDAWRRSALNSDTGEAFLFVSLVMGEAEGKVALCTFKFYDDGSMFFDMNTASDALSEYLDDSGFVSTAMADGEEAFVELVSHLLA